MPVALVENWLSDDDMSHSVSDFHVDVRYVYCTALLTAHVLIIARTALSYKEYVAYVMCVRQFKFMCPLS